MPATPQNVNYSILSGRRLAAALDGRTAPQKAIIIAEWRHHGAVLVDLTLAQWSALADVSVGYLSKASQLSVEESNKVFVHERPLIGRNGNGQRNGHGESLAEHLVRSSPAERVAAGRALGVAAVWDEMIAPVIEDRAE
jgi:hypothetical protein